MCECVHGFVVKIWDTVILMRSLALFLGGENSYSLGKRLHVNLICDGSEDWQMG